MAGAHQILRDLLRLVPGQTRLRLAIRPDADPERASKLVVNRLQFLVRENRQVEIVPTQIQVDQGFLFFSLGCQSCLKDRSCFKTSWKKETGFLLISKYTPLAECSCHELDTSENQGHSTEEREAAEALVAFRSQ